MNWREALDELKSGNARFVASRTEAPRRAADRRAALLAGQEPFAAILGCADSRVAPELIFDQGLGDLFVIRVAGNVLDDLILASLEYAAGRLDVPLIVVLGHAGCGAVTAAMAEGALEGRLPSLVAAVEMGKARAGESPEAALERATRNNVRHVAAGIRAAEPVLATRVRAGQLRVIEAHYDSASGAVSFIA